MFVLNDYIFEIEDSANDVIQESLSHVDVLLDINELTRKLGKEECAYRKVPLNDVNQLLVDSFKIVHL